MIAAFAANPIIAVEKGRQAGSPARRGTGRETKANANGFWQSRLLFAQNRFRLGFARRSIKRK
jgi:hypothetical protein